MTARSNAQLARQLTAQITNGNCKYLGTWWSEQEAAHAQTTTPGDARNATEPALALCEGCPAHELCRQRAELDRYTGLAAGAVYINGHRKPPTTVPRHPTPTPRAPGRRMSAPAQGGRPGGQLAAHDVLIPSSTDPLLAVPGKRGAGLDRPLRRSDSLAALRVEIRAGYHRRRRLSPLVRLLRQAHSVQEASARAARAKTSAAAALSPASVERLVGTTLTANAL